jgi:hypothetical protein
MAESFRKTARKSVRKGARPAPAHDAQPTADTPPAMPHERDEMVDPDRGAPSDQMRQAHDDIERGLQDTDRGGVTDAAYRRQKD